MSFAFTANGLTIDTFQDIFNDLITAYQNIYGNDIDVDPESPDGQRISDEAKARADIQAFCLALYNQLDPDSALGTFLEKLIKYAGVSRRAGTRSQVDVTVVTSQSVTLPGATDAGGPYTVVDTLNQAWTLDTGIALVAGTNTVTLFAANFGAVTAAPNTVTTPQTIILGVTSVTNPLAATIGVDEETDVELRIRRAKSVQLPATSQVGGLYAALGNLAGVTDLAIAENYTDTDDAVTPLTKHTIWCVILGGDATLIAQTIAQNKTMGCNVKGSTVGTWNEVVTMPDGSTKTLIHAMPFDRPTTTQLYVKLNAHARGSIPVDTALIAAQLALHAFPVNDQSNNGGAVASELYADVYTAGTTFVASALQISDDGGVTWTDGELDSGFGGQFQIQAANVTVTVI